MTEGGEATSYVVRYGLMRQLRSAVARVPLSGAEGIVRTERGEEYAEVLWRAAAQAGPELDLRPMEDRDREAQAAQRRAADEDRALIESQLELAGLALELVAVERVLYGDHLTIYYCSDEHLDWRELAREIHERRGAPAHWCQVGQRVKAKLCGGVGVCGRELCCATVLREMTPVTMRMAARQARSLAPEDTAGVCGRLKCCLRYELDDDPATPFKIGSMVTSARVSGRIVALDGPGRTAIIEDASGRRTEVFLKELEPRT